MKLRTLNLLIVFALIITIGGTYAAWTYYEGNIENTKQNVKIKLATAETSVAGEFTITDNGLEFTIDQNSSNYDAKIVKSGSATIKYTSNGTTECNQVYLKFELSGCPDNVFTIVQPENPFTLTGNTLTLNASDIELAIAETFTLPTMSAYTDFNQTLNNATLTITVSATEFQQ